MGLTDAGKLEDEVIVLVDCHMDDAEQEMTTCSQFLCFHNPRKGDASGLLECIGEAMHLLGMDNVLDQDSVLGIGIMPVLIGLVKDGVFFYSGTQWVVRSNAQRLTMDFLVLALYSQARTCLQNCFF